MFSANATTPTGFSNPIAPTQPVYTVPQGPFASLHPSLMPSQSATYLHRANEPTFPFRSQSMERYGTVIQPGGIPFSAYYAGPCVGCVADSHSQPTTGCALSAVAQASAAPIQLRTADGSGLVCTAGGDGVSGGGQDQCRELLKLRQPAA